MTEKVKHTPGPWIVKHEFNVFGDRGGHEGVVASCGGYATNADKGEHSFENEANARLCAAAPDLLKALRDITDDLACYSIDDDANNLRQYLDDVHARCRAAIRKAEGGGQ